MKLLPLALNVQGRNCVVFGAGAVARRKALSLLECGAQLKVVAPHFAEDWANLQSEKIECVNRPYLKGDCKNALLVFACTNDANVNRQIAEEALELNILCNVADESEVSDFHSMATLRRGDICVGISTSGGSPALSRHLKEKISETIGPEYESLLELLAVQRETLPQRINEQSQRARLWRAVLDSDLLNLLRAEKSEEAAELLHSLLLTNDKSQRTTD
jgi:precorrin-2 dehydrogenase/sirohydrochlorin ferrochelatase